MSHPPASALTPRAFRDALGRYTTGVCVVTTQSDDGPVGITANSFASVSLDPPLVLWSPARTSLRFPAFANAQHFAIHVLGHDQREICERFASGGGSFEGLTLGQTTGGAPELPGCLAVFDCTLSATHDGGDHLVIVGEVTDAQIRDGAPLVFLGGQYGQFEAN